MTDETFAEIMTTPHESSGVEFKGPGLLSDSRLVAQTVKAVLGLANHRTGGAVIIGVRETANSFIPVGLSDAELQSWNFDAVADQIARYADPAVAFQLEIKQYDEKRYVVIDVFEFSDIPVLCKRSYNNILRNGACYVRTSRKPETSELPTQTEMRQLLDLAVDKGIRQLVDRAERLGFHVPRIPGLTRVNLEPFNEEREEAE